jgi:putative membrane protein
MPRLDEVAVRDEVLHTVEHLSFLASALLLWWAVVRSTRGTTLGLGAGIFLLFTTALQEGLLGALLTFAPRPPYGIHGQEDPGFLGLGPLADQQLAGIIMWIPGGLVHLMAAVVVAEPWLVRRRSSHAGASSAGSTVCGPRLYPKMP